MSTVSPRACPRCATREPTASFCGRCGREIDRAPLLARPVVVLLAALAVGIPALTGLLILQAVSRSLLAGAGSAVVFLIDFALIVHLMWQRRRASRLALRGLDSVL
jgi:hypothetical protein